MTRLTHDRYCDEITHQIGLLRSLLTSGVALAAPVPTCPEWTIQQLVEHTGGALRWVEALVRTRAEQDIPEEEIPLVDGPAVKGDAAALEAWLTETGDLVTAALREAGPDAKVWSWAGMVDAGFWSRRMCHEVTIHRADATLAAGLPFEVAPEVAADAVDEWLQIVQWLQRTRPIQPEVPGSSIHLHATDAPAGLNAEWIVELPGDGVVWRRGHEKATVALRGPLTSVLLAFYRRVSLDSPGLEVLGERELLEFWLERATFE
ncbi:maleylpyruvate isomerase family mycothiol-dependent enzyme [Streptomyces sp. NPDC006458]|uniref:maleylpyruvate isomerase family mycothiol-dependent enzyme n=1 Tax=Streptomyces sp. NPDC006458 TaxID=3154302 RepID=UPI00339E96D8